ncbi:MAG: hypothetical protein WBN94_11490 [Methanothrix sp.]
MIAQADGMTGHGYRWLDGCGMADQSNDFKSLATITGRRKEKRLASALKMEDLNRWFNDNWKSPKRI